MSVANSGHWYDLSVAATPSASTAAVLYRRYMGRLETGADTTSDPAMARGAPVAGRAKDGLDGQHTAVHPASHPVVDVRIRTLQRVESARHKDAAFARKTEL